MTPPPAMLDNPYWAHRGDAYAERVLTRGPAACTVSAAYDLAAGHWRLQPALPEAAGSQLTSFSTAVLGDATPASIRQRLARLDGLQRFSAGCCWEALATAVIRQVIRAGQARRVWHRLAAALAHPGERAGRFPTAERFLAASGSELAEAGLGFKTRTLLAVADACRAEQRAWDLLDPVALQNAWLDLPGIGPWSAGAAIADLRNAWQLYPHDDLAVRTWAARAFPDAGIPTDPRRFSTLWTEWAGDALGALTVLTLGWSATYPQ